MPKGYSIPGVNQDTPASTEVTTLSAGRNRSKTRTAQTSLGQTSVQAPESEAQAIVPRNISAR